jgi:hypothetical protein
MPPKPRATNDEPDEQPTKRTKAVEHVFTEYACDCGASWPKSQGPVCPECHPKPATPAPAKTPPA